LFRQVPNSFTAIVGILKRYRGSYFFQRIPEEFDVVHIIIYEKNILHWSLGVALGV